MRTDNFNIIKEILAKFEEQFDEKNIDWSKFNCEALNMSLPRWIRIMEMLDDGGIIKGFSGNTGKPNITMQNIRFTFKGLKVAEQVKKNNFNIDSLL